MGYTRYVDDVRFQAPNSYRARLMKVGTTGIPVNLVQCEVDAVGNTPGYLTAASAPFDVNSKVVLTAQAWKTNLWSYSPDDEGACFIGFASEAFLSDDYALNDLVRGVPPGVTYVPNNGTDDGEVDTTGYSGTVADYECVGVTIRADAAWPYLRSHLKHQVGDDSYNLTVSPAIMPGPSDGEVVWASDVDPTNQFRVSLQVQRDTYSARIDWLEDDGQSLGRGYDASATVTWAYPLGQFTWSKRMYPIVVGTLLERTRTPDYTGEIIGVTSLRAEQF